MPRKSAASRSITTPTSSPIWLQPPATLSGPARELFVRIVSANTPKHFMPSDLPLLSTYVEACTMSEKATKELNKKPIDDNGRPSAWLHVQEKQTKIMQGLSMRLRLSPRSRAPNRPSRNANVAYNEFGNPIVANDGQRPWEDLTEE